MTNISPENSSKPSGLRNPAWNTGKARLMCPKWPTHSSMRLLHVPQSPALVLPAMGVGQKLLLAQRKEADSGHF